MNNSGINILKSNILFIAVALDFGEYGAKAVATDIYIMDLTNVRLFISCMSFTILFIGKQKFLIIGSKILNLYTH